MKTRRLADERVRHARCPNATIRTNNSQIWVFSAFRRSWPGLYVCYLHSERQVAVCCCLPLCTFLFLLAFFLDANVCVFFVIFCVFFTIFFLFISRRLAASVQILTFHKFSCSSLVLMAFSSRYRAKEWLIICKRPDLMRRVDIGDITINNYYVCEAHFPNQILDYATRKILIKTAKPLSVAELKALPASQRRIGGASKSDEYDAHIDDFDDEDYEIEPEKGNDHFVLSIELLWICLILFPNRYQILAHIRSEDCQSRGKLSFRSIGATSWWRQ